MMTQLNNAYPFEDLKTGMTPENSRVFKEQMRFILKNPNKLVDQKRQDMVDAALKTLAYPKVSDEALSLIDSGVICLLGEGPAPYHPRYVAPDFEKILSEGSDFFELEPAKNLYDAITHLLTIYHYSPTGGPPPYIGHLDALLMPYYETVSEIEARQLLKSFWVLIDRLYPDAFVHGVIGPSGNAVGEALLAIDQEVKTITNLTMLYDPDVTPRSFALQAVRNALDLSKPYFLNHPLHLKTWGEDYVVASCYNIMRLSGGIFTLVRVNLAKLAETFKGSYETLIQDELPRVAAYQVEVINSRIRHLVEEIGWFDQSVFVREGYLDPRKFSAYAGFVGLNELVNTMMAREGNPEAKFGHDAAANQMGFDILDSLRTALSSQPSKYCCGTDGHVTFHAQVGITADVDVTPGQRFPAGQEPDLYPHLRAAVPLQSLVEGGVSDILTFDQTARQNPEAVLDIIEGAMRLGLRNLSLGAVDSEYIRVSGYLVRRSDMENRRKESLNRYDTADTAIGFLENQPHSLHRRIRKV